MPPSSATNWRFLVDEDMPRSLALALRAAGYDAVDVRDVGLKGFKDEPVFAYAQSHQRALISEDMGFANILRFPLGTHAGIVVARFPNSMPTAQVNQQIVARLSSLAGQSLYGALVIIQPGRLRVRRLP